MVPQASTQGSSVEACGLLGHGSLLRNSSQSQVLSLVDVASLVPYEDEGTLMKYLQQAVEGTAGC